MCVYVFLFVFVYGVFTYRPCEVEGKHDGIAESLDVKIGDIQRVSTEHWRGDVTEGAWWRSIDIRLVDLEANAEFSPAWR